ncbi:MAG: Hsp20 family protein [Alphaproteobacteria bacterium]|jgi:HSP20 family molecular chaperone IbpA
MTRVSLLNSPLLLGFDEFERTLERIAKAPTEGYPPYNIERTGDEALRITLAVAGFDLDDLDIQVEDNQLMVRGRQAPDAGERIFLHRGIATRQFQRSFVLADGVEVTGAELDNGLLHVDLHLPRPQRDVRRVEIRKAGRAGKADGARTIDVAADEA